MNRADMAARAREAVAAWPPLSEAQRLRLAVLLRPDLPLGIERPRAADKALRRT